MSLLHDNMHLQIVARMLYTLEGSHTDLDRERVPSLLPKRGTLEGSPEGARAQVEGRLQAKRASVGQGVVNA